MFESVIETLKQKELLTPVIENYLLDLKRFTYMRKKDTFVNSESISIAMFKHDFEAIHEAEYQIDPNSLPILEKPLQYKFFHDKEQREHISNQLKLYTAHAVGMGKMLQRTNLRLMFRRFTKSLVTKNNQKNPN